jgi:hypothetical protein
MIRLLALLLLIPIAHTTPAQAQQTSCDHPFSRPYYKTRGEYCSIGQLVDDQYSLGQKVKCEDVEVDHLVSLFYAYTQGVCGDDLKRLANDPRNLRFTHRQTNRAKASKSPEEFADTLPPKLAENVLSDADGLRSEYGFRPISNLSRERRLALLSTELDANRRQIGELADVNNRIVRYKGKAMPIKAAVNEHTTGVSHRLALSAYRNFGSMPAEALPYFGVSVILAATAWEVYDLCEALKDNYELAVAFNPDLAMTEEVRKVCAIKVPSQEELMEQVLSKPGQIWESANESYQGIDISLPSWSEIREYMLASWSIAKDRASWPFGGEEPSTD